jgi:hypothetical protein
MARKPKKPAPQPEAAKSFDEIDDEEAGDEEVAVDDEAAADAKLRDWRDVEKYKEERALRRMIDDELDFDEPVRRRR